MRDIDPSLKKAMEDLLDQCEPRPATGPESCPWGAALTKNDCTLSSEPLSRLARALAFTLKERGGVWPCYWTDRRRDLEDLVAAGFIELQPPDLWQHFGEDIPPSHRVQPTYRITDAGKEFCRGAEDDNEQDHHA